MLKPKPLRQRDAFSAAGDGDPDFADMKHADAGDSGPLR
jgi:hypothetical protein